MSAIHNAVKEFHRAFGVPINYRAGLPNMERRELRRKILHEEYLEYIQAEAHHDLVEIADALADMAYVICGTCLEYGIPFDDVIAEVHRANMSKLGEDGKPIHREDGKVIKGPNYAPPDLAKVLNDRSPASR